MKKSMLLLWILCLSFSFAQAQEWNTNMDEAMEKAVQENRTLILVFKGSDWCAPCIKLDQNIFESETFQLYAKDHFIMVEADFPKRKKNALPEALQNQNNNLAEKYNPRGIFPFVVVLNAEGKVLGETGYFKANPSQYILHLESFKG